MSIDQVAVIVVAYFIGAIPFGLLIAAANGIDIRQHGSGNIGATNVGRVLGAKWGIACLILDALKGLLPVWWLPEICRTENSGPLVLLQVMVGIFTIIGHMFPIYLGFRGGKGVATSLGVVIVLGPMASLASVAAFVLGMLMTQIVSISSILAAVAFCGFQLWRVKDAPFDNADWPITCFSIAVPLLIVYRHRTNIVRIWRGEEPRFRFGKS